MKVVIIKDCELYGKPIEKGKVLNMFDDDAMALIKIGAAERFEAKKKEIETTSMAYPKRKGRKKIINNEIETREE